MNLSQLLVTVIVVILGACNVPDHYFTPAPECTTKQSKEYKAGELTEIVQSDLRNRLKKKSPKDYRYFFETFSEEGKSIYMITNFRNDRECFNIKVLVNKWDKLEGMRKANGESYPSELYDLKWELRTINGQEEVVYIDMHRIID